MRFSPLRPLAVLGGIVALLVAGCFSLPPPPAYYNVDRETPAFKDAVAREAAHQQELGKPADKAEKIAAAVVSRGIIERERARRGEEVEPLLAALAALKGSRGCWAYTLTTTTTKDGKTTVDVENYDAFQPEERLWTLVTRNGQAPDEKTQADYRRDKLKAWKRQLSQSPPKRDFRAEGLKWQAEWDEMEIAPGPAAGATTYTFNSSGGRVVGLVDVGAKHESYITDDASHTVRQHHEIMLAPSAFLGGLLKLQTYESKTDYVLIEPGLPPFIARSKVHYHGQIFGVDSGEMEIESVYSDYRRVKCYDDRFEVRVGIPTATDLTPGR
jgi:hypothetical protein